MNQIPKVIQIISAPYNDVNNLIALTDIGTMFIFNDMYCEWQPFCDYGLPSHPLKDNIRNFLKDRHPKE